MPQMLPGPLLPQPMGERDKPGACAARFISSFPEYQWLLSLKTKYQISVFIEFQNKISFFIFTQNKVSVFLLLKKVISVSFPKNASVVVFPKKITVFFFLS
jgi:hypothetical protein